MDETFQNNAPVKGVSAQSVPPFASRSFELSQQDETILHGRTFSSSGVDLGEPFGQYRLIEEVGRGGVGVVYCADQERPKRRVAIKILHGGERATDDEVRRLHAEADSAAALDHKYIVPVYEVGEVDGRHFLAMAFVEGGTLAELLQKDPLPAQRAATLLRQIAEGVAFAQSHDIVHRDLKPSNILLDKNGDPRVADFGLAKQLKSDSQLTATGQIMGTPSYMAPEQATGLTELIGTATDVYALGGVLYCMLTGRPPFQAATLTETLIQVVQCDPVAPSVVNPAVDRDLEGICLKCLDKSPARRYADASEVEDELRRYSEGRPLRARRVGPLGRGVRWVRRNSLTAMLLAAVALSLVVGTILSTFFALQARDRADKIERLSRELIALAVRVEESERIDPNSKLSADEQRHTPSHAQSSSGPTKGKQKFNSPVNFLRGRPESRRSPTQRVHAIQLRKVY